MKARAPARGGSPPPPLAPFDQARGARRVGGCAGSSGVALWWAALIGASACSGQATSRSSNPPIIVAAVRIMAIPPQARGEKPESGGLEAWDSRRTSEACHAGCRTRTNAARLDFALPGFVAYTMLDTQPPGERAPQPARAEAARIHGGRPAHHGEGDRLTREKSRSGYRGRRRSARDREAVHNGIPRSGATASEWRHRRRSSAQEGPTAVPQEVRFEAPPGPTVG